MVKTSSAATDDDTFEVEEILEHRKQGGRMQFKIKWKGYGLDECTWQREGDLSGASDVLNAYKSKHPVAFPQATPKATPKAPAPGRDQENKKKQHGKEEKKKSDDDKKEETSADESSELSADETTESDDQETKEDSDNDDSDSEESDEDQYEVESIVSHRVFRGTTWYMVAWKGCPGEDSEILEEDLAGAPELLEAYKKKHVKAPAEKKKASSASSSKPKEKKTCPREQRSPARKRRSNSPSPSPGPSNKRARRSLNDSGSTPSSPDSIVLPKSSPKKRAAAGASPVKKNEVDSPVKRKASPEAKESPKKAKKDATPPPSSPKKGKKDSPVKESSPAKINDKSPPQSPTRVMPRRSCTNAECESAEAKQYGITSGLRVQNIISLKKNENEAFMVKVTYRDPIPTGFRRTEVVPSRLVRDSSDYQILFDYYEGILRI